MPKEFDEMVDSIWSSIRGKENPRTKKPFTRSDAFAIATARWKERHGNAPSVRSNEEDNPGDELIDALRKSRKSKKYKK